MIEDFLQKKLSSWLQEFIEFEKLMIATKEGMTIKNSTIKPKLVNELSQILGMPLEHMSGSIESLRLNLPWQRLFMLKQSEVQIKIEGVRLHCKLSSAINEPYLLKKKNKLISNLTEKLFNPLDTSHGNSSFINKKLKEYFLKMIILSVKDVCIEIEIDLKHKVELILKVESCILRREDGKNYDGTKIHLEMQSIGLYYRMGSNEEVELVSPANFSFERVRAEGGHLNKRVSTQSFKVDKIHVHLNNYNYGDIARVLLFVQWHNSFLHLPYEVWRVKPFVLTECKPIDKFVYCAQLIRQSIVENRFRTQLSFRRKYIALYSELLTTDMALKKKEELNQMEKFMPVWKIAAFRSFVINRTKNTIQSLRNEQKKNGKGGQNPEINNFNAIKNMVSGSWFRKWFVSEKDAKQLQGQFLRKIASIETVPSEVESIFNVQVETVIIGISIITTFGVEPFISLVGYHCELNKKQLLIEKTWERNVVFRKCKIVFEKYLGHHERYKNMLCESKRHLGESDISERSDEDEFEDINYFLEINYRNDSKIIEIKLLPFDLYVNHEVMEKLFVLLNVETLAKISKMEKIEEAYLLQYDPWLIVEHQRERVLETKQSLQLISQTSSLSPNKRLMQELTNNEELKDRHDTNEVKNELPKIRELCIKSAVNIIATSNMRINPEIQLILIVGSMEIRLTPTEKCVFLKKVILKGLFTPLVKQNEDPLYLSLINHEMNRFVMVLSFNVDIQIKNHISFDERFIEVSPIRLELPSLEHMASVIELIYLHLPRSKENKMRQYYKKRQSIGQEFMDACENLNDHIIGKSMVMSGMTNKIVMRQKRTKISSVKIEGVTLSASFAKIVVEKVQLQIKQMGYDNRIIQSYNQKQVKVIVYNLKQTLKCIQALQFQFKKESIKKGKGLEQKNERRFRNIQVENVNLEVVILAGKQKDQKQMTLSLQMKNMRFGENEESNNRRFQTDLKLSYDEKGENNNKKIIKIPFIEQCTFDYEETYKFNLHQRQMGIDSLSINIKPSLFRMMSLLIKEYHIDQKIKFKLTNGVGNTIRVKVPPKNFYVDYKCHQHCMLESAFCEIALFNRKLELQFNENEVEEIPRDKIQCVGVGGNNFLMNCEVAPNQYRLESNMRFVNHQERTVWIKLGQQDHSGKAMSLALKPEEITHLLIDSDEHKYLQIVDQGNHYTEVHFNQLLLPTQIVVKNEDSDEKEYLVLKSIKEEVQGIQGSIFTFHIYSPIYIVNHTPWILEYRLSKDQIIVEEIKEKRLARPWSLEVVPMKKIPTLSSERIRFITYNDIQTMNFCVKKYEREFPMLGNVISRILDKKSIEKNGFYRDQELITLRNVKSEIQLVLGLKFSENIMRIKVYPQFVFVNLASISLSFRIKEEDVTYHQINLTSLRFKGQQKIKNQKQHNMSVNTYLNQLANLSTEKFQTKQVLKQLFETYQDSLQAFTGSLKLDVIKKMVYSSGWQLIRKDMGFLKSTRGYLSDIMSEAEQLQEHNAKKQSYKQCLLSQQEEIKFGLDKHLLFKRFIPFSKDFSLVILMPTVHIINKSQATFYAKSGSQVLVKISKESHNFIVTNQGEVDVQACLEEEQISLSEWTRIDLQDLKTIYYSKAMLQNNGSGYQSKEYIFRKKRMRKIPKIFFKVAICRYKWGQKIIIQESQYPPISFINNTRHRIKLQEIIQRFEQELINKGDMGQYSPKDPYHTPIFRLSIAQHYQYKQLKDFNVLEKQCYSLDYGIALSIQQYKDKVIINIKDTNEMKLAISMIERSLINQMKDSDEKGDWMLEEMKKNTLTVKHMTIAVLNSWNQEINCTIVEDAILNHEDKNYKDYFKIQIKKMEGYDFMGIQPDFIFHAKKKDKKIFGLQNKESKLANFIECQLIVNVHKNALIIEKCDGMMTESVFYISADLILAYVKNYYEPCYIFKEVITYYRRHRSQQKQPEWMQRKFIVESLKWEATSLTMKARNLSMLETFLNKSYEKLIVKFLIWLGDIKPLTFDRFELNHEQITLRSLINRINLRKKMHSFVRIIMDYPLSELREIVMLFAGDEKTVGDKLNTFYKILKSVKQIAGWTLSLNQNLRGQIKTYNQFFIQKNKENTNIIDKMRKFEFCEWKYSAEFSLNKLIGKFSRLQRSNIREIIVGYDQWKARIKLAIDSFTKNKVYRVIENIYRINKQYIAAVVNEWIVIYGLKSEEWIVIRVEHFLNCRFDRGNLIFTYWQVNELSNAFDSKGGRVSDLQLKSGGEEFNKETISEFIAEIKENALSHYY